MRVSELLDWLGRRLSLVWIEAARPAAAPVAPAPAMVLPTVDVLKALDELVGSGYVRGIHRMLDRIAEDHPECVDFVAHVRTMARQFQLEAISGFLRKAQQPPAERAAVSFPEPQP